MSTLIGIDLGSSSVKCAAFDHSGQIKAHAEHSYLFSSPREGWLEIDPETWWDVTHAALKETISQLAGEPVDAIAVSGVMLMAVALDASGRAVRPTLSWLDRRVLPQFESIQKSGIAEELFAATGTAVAPSQTPYPLLWMMQEEPDRFKRIAKVVLPKDYLRYRLTGTMLTDVTDASGTLLLDSRTGQWNQGALERLGIPSSILPDVVASSAIAGRLLPEVAATLNLPAGVPVIAGSGDGVSTMLGLGIVRPGQLGITVGTAGVLMSASDRFLVDERGRCLVFRHPIPGQYFLVTATNTSGEAIRWFSNMLQSSLPETERYARLNAAAAASPPGSRGVVFLPYLAGSRSPHYNPSAKACFLGLDLMHEFSDLARAAMEGVCFEIRDCLDVHREVLGSEHFTIDEVLVSGGIVRSPLWLQILADATGTTLSVPVATELGALGAAINAAVGIGIYPDYLTATATMVRIANRIVPNEGSRHAYDHAYYLYRESYRALMPVFPGFSAG